MRAHTLASGGGDGQLEELAGAGDENGARRCSRQSDFAPRRQSSRRCNYCTEREEADFNRLSSAGPAQANN